MVPKSSLNWSKIGPRASQGALGDPKAVQERQRARPDASQEPPRAAPGQPKSAPEMPKSATRQPKSRPRAGKRRRAAGPWTGENFHPNPGPRNPILKFMGQHHVSWLNENDLAPGFGCRGLDTGSGSVLIESHNLELSVPRTNFSICRRLAMSHG